MRKRIKIVWGLSFLLIASSLMAQSDIGICGWRAKQWQQFLEKECAIKSDILKQETGRIPVEEFNKYKFVILSQDRPKPLTENDNKIIKEYLKNGGNLLVTTITIGGLVPYDKIRKFSEWADWIGATTYFYGEIPVKIYSSENPLVSHFTKQEYDWFKSPPGLTDITTGKIIIGSEKIGKVFINQYGKGVFVYLSPIVMSYYKEGWQEDPESSSLLLMVKKIIFSILKNDPPIEEVLKKSKSRNEEIVSVDGKKRKTIILSDSSNISIARTLGNYLNKITSGDIRVILDTEITEEIKKDYFKIYVGNTNYVNETGIDFDKLHPYGYYIITGSDNMIISGKNQAGTSFAVYDFLKRFCGYRYFMPGTLGEIIPKRDIIPLSAKMFIKEEPSFITYTNTGFYGGNGVFSRSWRTTLLASHNLYNIYSPEKYSEKHPEYYPMVEGKRFAPSKNLHGTWQPCVSNPDLPDIAIEWAKEYFKQKPYMIGIPVGVNDGGGDCQCPDCLKLREKFKNQYVPFYNNIARLAQKNLPDKLVSFLAYGRGAAPIPENIKLEPNIYVEVVSGLKENMKLLEEWKQAGAKNIGIYDYFYGGGYLVPRHYPHIIGNAWKQAYKKVNLKGGWFESFIQIWLYDGPRQYVLNELAWNINLDIDKLLDDYFVNFYGDASKPMREFFDRIEEIYGRKKDPLYPMADWKNLKQLDEYTWGDIEYLNNKLVKAKEITKEPQVKKRLDLFEKIWKLSELYLQSYLVVKDLTTIKEVKNEKNIEDIINKAKIGFQAVKSAENYTMTPEEEKAIFVNTNLESFKNQQTLNPKPFLENETYRVFAKITEYLEKQGKKEKDIETFWKQIAQESEDSLKKIVLSQIFVKKSPEVKKNLVINGSFEPEQEPSQEEIFDEEKLGKFQWERLNKKLKGWTIWHFQQSVTRFFWDSSQAHTGRYSVSIGENQISGCFQTGFRVKPGCGYFLSFWVKQSPPDKGGSLTIRWMNAEGWADQGTGKAPRISIPYPQEKESTWRRVNVFFTAPEAVTTCLLVFGAPRQEKEEFIWFDDVEVYKVFDPDFFDGGR